MKYLKEYVMQMVQFDKKNFGYEQRQELVRCKDCIGYGCDTYLERGDDNWFCADGKRKDE